MPQFANRMAIGPPGVPGSYPRPIPAPVTARPRPAGTTTATAAGNTGGV
jgi:hypothetical protein